MKHQSSVSIFSIDFSYRASGYSAIDLSFKNEIHLQDCSCVVAPELGNVNFNNLESGINSLNESMKYIIELLDRYEPDVLIVEMPCFSQSAKSAIMIGMCWGILSQLINKYNPLLVEPSALKLWSGSKKGDGKELVKEKVLERVCIEKYKQSNDNVIDAIGLGLMFVDKITELRYKNK